MRYDLDDLRLFVAVAESGSLSRGAARVHRSAGAASARLAQLEATFATVLLRRRSRGMVPTPAGEALLRQARALLTGAEVLNAEMGAYASGVQGVVRLLANTNATNVFLPRDLASFLAAQPQANVLLEERASPEIVAVAAAGAADLGIVAAMGGHPELIRRPYREDHLVLAMAADHPLARRRTLAFADALDEPFVSLDGGSAIHGFLLDHARAAGRVLRLRIQVRGFDAVCRMAAAGVGVGLVPRSAAEQAAGHYPLAWRELADPWAPRAMEVVARPESLENRYVAALVEHLAGSATRGPGGAE